MELKDHLKQIERLRNAAREKLTESILVPAANEFLAETKNRIVVEGKNSSGRQIGTYSKKPMYAGLEDFDKGGSFKPRGKKETGVTKSGKDKVTKGIIGGKKVPIRKDNVARKTMYLPDGYFQLRGIQGKPNSFVNLNYTGTLIILDYQLQVRGNEIVIGLITERSSLIRQGLEEGTRRKLGYGKVLAPTITEIDNFRTHITNQTRLITTQILDA